ncbi:MAG TPA: type II toxin-antitoxin system RelE/ParE family toxin [Longimicrobium sp.]
MIYYGVIVQPRAERDIEQAYRFRARQNRAAADRWLDEILVGIESLEEMPSRCPVAPESAYVDREVRHLIHREHRIIFLVQERHVRVLTVRHAARKPLRRIPQLPRA